MVRTRSLAVLAVTIAVLALPTLARAVTYCVSDPGCTGTQELTLQDALTVAESANDGPDTVKIGPGTFDVGTGASYNNPNDAVTIVGAGPLQTTLTTSDTTADHILTLTGSTGSSVSDLGFLIGNSSAAIKALTTPGSVDSVVIKGTAPANSTGIMSTGPGLIRHVTIDLPHDSDDPYGIDVHASATIEDSSISAWLPITAGAGTPIDVSVRRVTLRGSRAVLSDGPDVAVNLEDSLILLARDHSPDVVGLVTANDPPSITANNVTMVGPGGPNSVAVDSSEGRVTLRNTVLSGFTTALKTELVGSIVTDYSNYGGVNQNGGTGTIIETHRLNVAPGFVNPAAGDYGLAPGSALINAGDPASLAAGESPFDFIGNPRISGGRRDIGAYEFQQQPVANDTTAPVFSKVSLTNRTFAVGKGRTPVSAKRKRVKVGTTFRFTLSEAASVKLAIARKQPGRRVGKACRKPSRKNRKRRYCARFVKKGTLTRAGNAGSNSVRFTGRIGRRALKPGSYRVTITATDAAGNKSNPKVRSFRVVRRATKNRH